MVCHDLGETAPRSFKFVSRVLAVEITSPFSLMLAMVIEVYVHEPTFWIFLSCDQLLDARVVWIDLKLYTKPIGEFRRGVNVLFL